ncbi:MAG: AAA family ATPase [Alphaproteobacteria bacterium]|nr:AAA family ATPase [Alphaproteobacteria bacterium]
MSSYRLNLFGGFDLRDDQGAAITIRSKKGRCLLTYLALAQGQQKPRDELAALLWGDRGDTQARRSLSQELYRLRGLFPEDMQDGFALEAESVGLNEGLFDVDVVNLERGLESGDAEVAALYTGELLAGQEASQESFDDWLASERLRERAISGLHEIMRARLDGPTEAALESANRVLALDPASEEAHRAVMQLHGRAGRRDLALKQYDKCHEYLAEELGIEPDGESQELYEKIETTPAPAPQVAEIPEPAPAAEKAAERRQVTVMACGLVLEASARGALDPEDRREVMRICRDVAAALLERYDSRIANTLGDNLLAYFSYPEAREDDAERAARAGLEAVEAIAALDLPAGVSARCRAGIASGLVIAGDGEAETLVGEAPDMAVRLLQAAAPGAIAVDAATRELLASAFTLEALKGADESESAWRLVGEAHSESRFEAHRSGALTPFVGRELELKILFHRWGQAEDGEGQVVLISGEPGIGKSRIAETIHERLPAENHFRLLYQCSPHHTNSALHPVIEHLNFAAGLSADEPDEAKLDKLEALIAQATDGVNAIAPLFADLLSIRHDERYPALNLTPQAQKERTLQALVALLVGLAAHKPVLFVFEDLHWADPTTQELLDLTMAGIGEARVLALLTFRPEYEAPWVGQSHAMLMAVNRLGKRQCGEMAQSVAAKSELSEVEISEIVAKTDGVPLFVEELTKTLLGGDSSEAVPATIQASLTARLDRLGPAREVAQVGAVIGREFSYPLLAGVAAMAEGTLAARLEALTDSQLVFARGAPPDASYTFKHALVQDAAYESMLKPRRKALHARVAEVLETQTPDIAETQPELLAHHYTEAGSTAPAVDYWHRAAQQALGRSSYFEAENHAKSGLGIVERLPAGDQRPRWQLALQSCLGTALAPTKGYADHQTGEAFLRAHEFCKLVDDEEAVFPVYLGLHAFHVVRGEFEKSSEIAATSLKLAEHLPTPQPMIFSLYVSGFNNWFLGRLPTALQWFEKMIDFEDQTKPEPVAAQYGEEPGLAGRAAMTMVLWNLGYPDRALEMMEYALASARELAHANTLVVGFQWTCMLSHFCGDRASLSRVAEELMAFSDEQRLTHWHIWARIYTGIAAIAMGGDKLAPLRQAIEDSHQIGPIFRPYFIASYADCCRKLGYVDEGHNALDQAMATHAETGEAWWLPEVHRVRGDLFLQAHPSQDLKAESAYLNALEVARKQEAKSLELRAAHSLARLWYGQGKSKQAHDLLAPVYCWFTEGFDTVDLKDAKALLEELG